MMKKLSLNELLEVNGGNVCSILDVWCLLGEGLKGRGGSTPPTCEYATAWNPAPPIRC